MQYVISCRLARKPGEICPDIYYFGGWDEYIRFDTRKEAAERFANLYQAESFRRLLVTRPSVLGCVIEPLFN